MKYKNTSDPEFAGHLISWMGMKGLSHVELCVHEGCHLLYARIVGYEPEVHGPSDETFYRRGVGWRRVLGWVDPPPPELRFSSILGKFYLGPSMIEDLIFGESHWKDIRDRARGDYENYHDWQYRMGNPIDQFGEEIYSVRAVRKSVYADFARAEFRVQIIDAAREFERRVFGPKTIETVSNDRVIGELQ